MTSTTTSTTRGSILSTPVRGVPYLSAGEPGVHMILEWSLDQTSCNTKRTTAVTEALWADYFKQAAAACGGKGFQPWNSPNGFISFYFAESSDNQVVQARCTG